MHRKYGLEISIAILSALFLMLAVRIERTRHEVRVDTTGAGEDGAITAVIPVGGTTQTIAAMRLGDVNWLFLPGSTEGADLRVDGDDAGRVANDLVWSTGDDDDSSTVHILTGSGQPCIFLTTEHDFRLVQEDEDKETSDEGTALILLSGGGLAYNGEFEDIHGRGNASWDQDKKGYNITLSKSAELPGLSHASEEYALVSHTDKSYVRNRTSLEICRAAGGLALDYITVDLYINGEYQGLYELHEKVTAENVGVTDLAQQNKSRNAGSGTPQQMTTGILADDWNTSVTGKWWDYHNEPSNVTGGYIIEANDAIRYEERKSGFITQLGAYFTMKSPSRLSPAEYAYISSYVQQVEDTMVSSVGSDSYDALSQLIDVPSFEAKYLVEEVSKNIDTCVTSQFFYKDTDDVLHAGPVWDHDWAYGVDRVQEDVDYSDPTGFSANVITGAFPWYQLLYYNAAFQEDVRRVYADAVAPRIREIAEETIAAWQKDMEQSAVMDLIRWDSFACDDPAVVRDRFYQEGQAVADFLTARDAFLTQAWGLAATK